MRNSNKAPKFSSMTEYELQNFYSNKKKGRKNVRQELSIYIVWSSAAIKLGRDGYGFIHILRRPFNIYNFFNFV
jgi:hypothetical protein